MMWHYHEPRAVTKLSILPVPFSFTTEADAPIDIEVEQSILPVFISPFYISTMFSYLHSPVFHTPCFHTAILPCFRTSILLCFHTSIHPFLRSQVGCTLDYWDEDREMFSTLQEFRLTETTPTEVVVARVIGSRRWRISIVEVEWEDEEVGERFISR